MRLIEKKDKLIIEADQYETLTEDYTEENPTVTHFIYLNIQKLIHEATSPALEKLYHMIGRELMFRDQKFVDENF